MGIQSSLVDDDHYNPTRTGVKIGYVPENSKLGGYITYQQGTKLYHYYNGHRDVGSFGIGSIIQLTSFFSLYGGLENINYKVENSSGDSDGDSDFNYNQLGACLGMTFSTPVGRKLPLGLYISPGLHTVSNYGFSISAGLVADF